MVYNDQVVNVNVARLRREIDDIPQPRRDLQSQTSEKRILEAKAVAQ